MTQNYCPQTPHFHVVFEQVGSFKRPVKTIVADEAEKALSEFISTLPNGWRGGISVFDDTNCHEDEMPIAHMCVN